MKKIILFLVLMIVLSSFVSSYTIVDSYTFHDASSGWGVQAGGANLRLAINVTFAVQTTLNGVSIKVDDIVGTHDVGDAFLISLVNDSGGVPTGGLADADAEITTILTDYVLDGWRNFSFGGDVVVPAESYFILLDFANLELGDYLNIFHDSGTGDLDVNSIRKIDAGAWTLLGWDYTFILFENATAPPPINSSSIDLLFSNSTSEYKTLFQESEEIEVYINYTDDLLNISLNDSYGKCNITVVNGVLEEIGTEDNFNLCDNILCSNITYSFEANFHSNDSYKRDFIRLEACHSQVALGNMVANISCGNNLYSEIITSSQIPLCSDGFGEIFIYNDSCSNYLNVNVSLSFSESYQRRKLINIIELDREYYEHFNIGLFNATSKLWYINHTHEYYEHGSKETYANCSYSIDINFNNSVSENITIVNKPPKVFINQVNNSLGIVNLTDNILIEYASGIWNFLISVIDDDIDTINYTFYNSSNHLILSKQSSYPIIFNSTDKLFVDFTEGNSYNLTVWVNDTFKNITYEYLTFNITDTGNPTYTGFTNTTHEINTNFTFSGQLQDEHLWGFDFKCNNSFTYSITGIGATIFNFVNNQSNITGDTLCNFNITDGHTGEIIDDFSLDSSANSFTFNGITIESEKTLKNIEFIKEYDKYKVCLETSEIESYLFLTMPDNCIKYPSEDYKGWYVCDNKYWFDTESKEDYPVWTDGGKALTIDIRTAKSKVICLDSIGVLNRVSGSQLITAVITPEEEVLTVSDRLGNTNKLILLGIFLLVWVFLIIFSAVSNSNAMMFLSGIFGILIAVAFISTFSADMLFKNMMLIFIFVNIMLMVIAGFRTGQYE